MGIMFIIILIAVLIVAVIEASKKDRSAYVLLFIPGVMLIISLTFMFDVKPKFRDFKQKYEMVNNINFDNLTIEGKKLIIDDIVYINNKIDFAHKYKNSFWFGLYTTDEYLKYDKIINLNKNE